MSQVRLSEISYPASVQTRHGTEINVARIVACGYPTDLIPTIHRIAQSIFGSQGRWHFDSLEFSSPMDHDLGVKRDDGWLCTAIAVMKPDE